MFQKLIVCVFSCMLFAFGGINPAMAATYNVIYDCNATDGGTGTAPDTETVTGGEDFTPATNTCTPQNGKHFSGWLIDGTSNILPAGVPVTYNYGSNINLIAQYTTGKFSITTKPIGSHSIAKFYLSASGIFTVDCGDGGTLSGNGVDGDSTTINRVANTNQDIYTCTYTTDGIKTITFDGLADGYNTNPEVAAVSLYASDGSAYYNGFSKYITSINGNLSNIFPYLGDSDGQRPIFYKTFHNCRYLTSIPLELFSGFTNITNANYMFRETFSYCTGLQTIPENLFSAFINVTNAQNMFFFTFLNCTGLQTTPENLFFSLGRTENAEGMFYGTFSGCTGLQTIPENLFSVFTNVTNAQAMFERTFSGCTGLQTIPENLFSAFAPIENAKRMFTETFSGCTGLQTIPENLFSAFINVTNASGMFFVTFANCTGLQAIPENLFSAFRKVENAEAMIQRTFEGCTGLQAIPENLFSSLGRTENAEGMFFYTFEGCTRLQTIPENLFSVFTNVTDAQAMFKSTFSNCTGLQAIPENLFSAFINVTNASGMFATTFSNCAGLTFLPDGLFRNLTNIVNNNWMFNGTFQDCSNLSGYIPPTFFGLDINNHIGYNMLNDIFNGTNLDTSCPSGTVSYPTGYEAYLNGYVSCTPAHVVDYNCGAGTTPAPANQNTGEYLNFTVAQNICTAPNNQHFTGWLISDSDNTIVQPGDAFQYLYTTNKTLTAQWTENTDIPLTWYDDNHNQLDVQNAAQTCQYGGTIIFPENPPKRTGYKLVEWIVGH